MEFEDYINAYYGGTLGISKRYGIEKAAITETTMAEGLNTLYGAKVFSQLNTKSEVFKLLKKEPWTSSGWRVMTGRHAQTNGIAEGAALGTTDQPDLVEVRATLAEVVTVWEVTTKAELLSEADDGLGNLAAFLRKEHAEAHAYYIDAMLLSDSETASSGTAGSAMDFETLDRVTISHAANGALNNAATDADMWDIADGGIDRSGSAWSDAYVSHNSGTERALTLAMLDAAISNSLEQGVTYSDLIILTGYDTYQDLKQLMQSPSAANGRWSYDLAQSGGKNMNGVMGEAGLAFDSRVGSYDGIPIFLSQHVISDADSASRLYLLDMANLAFRVAAPTTYVDSTNIAVTQTLSKDFAFLTAGNLICYKFKTQGSIRDIDA